MRIINKGAFVRVCVSAREVSEFKASWPCSTLPDRAIAFEFQQSNGDLVDISPDGIEGEDVAALASDAWEFVARDD